MVVGSRSADDLGYVPVRGPLFLECIRSVPGKKVLPRPTSQFPFARNRLITDNWSGYLWQWLIGYSRELQTPWLLEAVTGFELSALTLQDKVKARFVLSQNMLIDFIASLFKEQF